MVTTTILVILLLIVSKSHALLLTSNSSTFSQSLNPEPPPINLPLNEALEAIAAKERWDPDGGIRVSELDPISVRVGGSQRYELHVRVGRTVLMMKLSDGNVAWRKPGGFGSDLEFDGGFGVGPKPSVSGLELEGPMELRVDGGIDEEISLLLPAEFRMGFTRTHSPSNFVLTSRLPTSSRARTVRAPASLWRPTPKAVKVDEAGCAFEEAVQPLGWQFQC